MNTELMEALDILRKRKISAKTILERLTMSM